MLSRFLLIASSYDYRPNIHRRWHAAVDVAVFFFGAFFVGRKGWDIGGIGGLDDGVEMECDGIACLVVEVGEFEGNAAKLLLDAGDEFADLNIELNSIDVDNIVGAGVNGAWAGIEM